MVFRFHLLQVTFFCFSQSDFIKKKMFHVKKKKLIVKLNWQPLMCVRYLVSTQKKIILAYRKYPFLLFFLTSDAIHKIYKEHDINNWTGWWSKMVGGQLVCSTPRHTKSHRDIHDTWKRGYVHCLMQTKTEHQKFNGSRIGGCGRHNGPSTVDQAFSSHTRTSCTNNDNIPRQQKYNSASRKWKIFKFKENSSYKCTLLFYSRQDIKRWGQSSLLPYNRHARRLLYEATTGQHMQKNAKHHPKHARHWKNQHQAQECVGKWKE